MQNTYRPTLLARLRALRAPSVMTAWVLALHLMLQGLMLMLPAQAGIGPFGDIPLCSATGKRVIPADRGAPSQSGQDACPICASGLCSTASAALPPAGVVPFTPRRHVLSATFRPTGACRRTARTWRWQARGPPAA